VTGLVTVDGFRFDLEDGGWLIIRFSGTEPLLRIYCEPPTATGEELRRRAELAGI
jgi:phosphomannomutase